MNADRLDRTIESYCDGLTSRDSADERLRNIERLAAGELHIPLDHLRRLAGAIHRDRLIGPDDPNDETTLAELFARYFGSRTQESRKERA